MKYKKLEKILFNKENTLNKLLELMEFNQYLKEVENSNAFSVGAKCEKVLQNKVNKLKQDLFTNNSKIYGCVECHKLNPYQDNWFYFGEDIYHMFEDNGRLKESYCFICEHKTIGEEIYRK